MVQKKPTSGISASKTDVLNVSKDTGQKFAAVDVRTVESLLVRKSGFSTCMHHLSYKILKLRNLLVMFSSLISQDLSRCMRAPLTA